MKTTGFCSTCKINIQNLQKHWLHYHLPETAYQCFCGYTQAAVDMNWFFEHIKECREAELEDISDYLRDVKQPFKGFLSCKAESCGYILLDMETLKQHYKQQHPSSQLPTEAEALVWSRREFTRGKREELARESSEEDVQEPSAVDESSDVAQIEATTAPAPTSSRSR